MANIERESLGEKKKTICEQVLLKSIISATLSISIPFKAFSLSKYFNMYITVYIVKWAPSVLLIQDLKKKTRLRTKGSRNGKKNHHFSYK